MTSDIQIEIPKRYQCFVVFDPASVRVSDNDILVIGDKVTELFDKVYEQVFSNHDDIKMKILMNNFQKIGNMLDLLQSTDNVLISKFFDRVWRRYSYISHLGESFLDLQTFLTFFPV